VTDVELLNEIVFANSTEMLTLVGESLGYEPNVVVDRGGPTTLSFTVTDSDSVKAAEVANIHVEIYIHLRRESKLEEYLAGTAIIQQRLDDLNDRLAELQADKESAAEFARLETQRAGSVSIPEEEALSGEFGTNAAAVDGPSVPTSYVASTPDLQRAAEVVAHLLGFGDIRAGVPTGPDRLEAVLGSDYRVQE
jgi:hypothetical protein